MALITCPECKKNVSDTAEACPQCGFKLTPAAVFEIKRIKNKALRAQEERRKGCFVAIAIFVVLAVIGSFSTRTTRSTAFNAPSVSADDIAAAIASSDDFDSYRQVFVDAATQIIRDGRCSLAQLRENGGWVRSQTHKPRLVYFVYCGAPHVSNRFYIDVTTGQVFQ